MAEKVLSRILVDHGIAALYPLGPGKSRERIDLEKLQPVSHPRKLTARVYESGLDGVVKEMWEMEKIDAEAFIAYNSPDRYREGSWIQFYNVTK